MGFESEFEDMERECVVAESSRAELPAALLPMLLRRAEGAVKWMEREDLREQARVAV